VNTSGSSAGPSVLRRRSTYDHANGYLLDFGLPSCLTSYVSSTFTYVGTRSDGFRGHRSGAGNEYAQEGGHWDVTFHTCGGC